MLWACPTVPARLLSHGKDVLAAAWSHGSFGSLLCCRSGRKMPQFSQMSSKPLGVASSNLSVSQQPSPGSFAGPSAQSIPPANTVDEMLDGIGARKQCTTSHHRRHLLDPTRDTTCIAMPTDSVISEGFLRIWNLLECGLEQPASVAKGDLEETFPAVITARLSQAAAIAGMAPGHVQSWGGRESSHHLIAQVVEQGGKDGL